MDLMSAATEVTEKLQVHDYEAYWVGGCVRDMCLTVPVKDIDIATDATPDQVMELFETDRLVGKSFGVVIVKHAGHSFEITTYRRDGRYVDARHPESIEFGTLEDDAARRDFTINALYYDPVTQDIIDLHKGKQDLLARDIRTVGNPYQRFNEDILRILRAARFSVTHNLCIDHETGEAMRALAPHLTKISHERIRDELNKMLVANPAQALKTLDYYGILEVILPEIKNLQGCEQGKTHHPEGDVFVHTCLVLDNIEPKTVINVWSALLHDVAKPATKTITDGKIQFLGHQKEGAAMAREIMKRFKFSNDEIEAVAETVYDHMKPMESKKMNRSTLRRFLALDHIDHLLALHNADALGSNGNLENLEHLLTVREEFANEPVLPEPLITGKDLIEMGFVPGPQFREILERVQTLQLEGEIETAEEARAVVMREFS